MNLFVYGELCKPDVLMAKLGRVPPAIPAILTGYRRVLKSNGYYEARRSSDHRIAGLLLRDLDDSDLETLDAYENVEGGEYRRHEADVETVEETPRRLRAQVYVAPRSP